MDITSCFFLLVGILLYQASIIWCQCRLETGLNGTIHNRIQVSSTPSDYSACWRVKVPTYKFVRLRLTNRQFSSEACHYVSVEVKIPLTDERKVICHNNYFNDPFIALSDVDISFNYKKSGNLWGSTYLEFTMYFEIQDIECAQKENFRCSRHSCIPALQVCDGMKNCENGLDEVGCETGIASISGISEVRTRAIQKLIEQRTESWGWNENTARAITALYLAEGANFSRASHEEELMAKQMELKAAAAILPKSRITNEQLSMYINGLLVTCHNPRNFYGQNLVKRLKENLEQTKNFTHPLAYLTLCNANESLPTRAPSILLDTLNNTVEYPFFKDIKAVAVMAVSCYGNKTNLLNKRENSNLKTNYENVIKQFKESQMSDGSFGNVQTTSLITQALISSGHVHFPDWQLNATIKYLVNELKSSHADFLAYYLALPVLNGKSLSDISKINCSSTRKHASDDLVKEITVYSDPKMRIQYSLYIGDEKDIIHTISLRVPVNYTVYEVMQLAELEDYKYKFEWKKVSNKIYVYKIGKVRNDPEAGIFWLMFTNVGKSQDGFKHLTSSPDELILMDGIHLIMWYRSLII